MKISMNRMFIVVNKMKISKNNKLRENVAKPEKFFIVPLLIFTIVDLLGGVDINIFIEKLLSDLMISTPCRLFDF